jgi:hypothetical protein
LADDLQISDGADIDHRTRSIAAARQRVLAEPADVAIWKIGRVYSHAAIVIAWPKIIHADADNGVILGDGTQGKLANKPVRFFSLFS